MVNKRPTKKQHRAEHLAYWEAMPSLKKGIHLFPGHKLRCEWIVPRVIGDCLDCGCQDGTFTNEIAKAGHKAVGIDILPFNIKQAKRNYPDCQFFVMDIEEMDFKDESFDTVVMTETLEHLINPKIGLKEAQRVLKKGGRFLCSVPNGYDPQPTHYNTFDYKGLTEIVGTYFEIEDIEGDLGSFRVVARKA